MLCTDVLSRGIDVDNIDWVVQFDVPKQTRFFFSLRFFALTKSISDLAESWNQ